MPPAPFIDDEVEPSSKIGLVAPPLAVWESFYVIVGSSAAALTGLQFVVIVLASEIGGLGDPQAISAFGSPTITHFCAVLFISALLSAPWHGLLFAAVLLGACGVGGVIYVVLVLRHARQQKSYEPVLEDWIWHGALPFVAYTALLVAAMFLPRDPTPALFAVAAAAVLLLFIGIHNAWDAVTYMALERLKRPKGAGDRLPKP